MCRKKQNIMTSGMINAHVSPAPSGSWFITCNVYTQVVNTITLVKPKPEAMKNEFES